MGVTAIILNDRNPVCNRKRLLYMQISLFPVFSDSAIIIYTIGYIRILLNLRDQNILSDRMDRSRLYKQYIAFLHRHRIQHLKKRILLNPSCKLFPADLFLESVI